MDSTRGKRGRKKKLSPQEGRELAKRWRASGLIAAEYCRRNQVNLHVLRYWAARSKRKEATDGRSDFFVVTAKSKPAPNEGEARPEEGVSSDGGARAVMIVVPLQRGAVALTEALRAVFAEDLR